MALERYVPAFLTWIASKLSRGASQHYLRVADVALLAVLIAAERDTLIALLNRLHENLPEVDAATARYVAESFPKAGARQRARTNGGDDE